MRLRSAAWFAGGAVLGVGVGFALAIFLYPFIFLADVVATEPPDAAAGKALSRGSFIHANPRDAVHHGKGSVAVFHRLVRLEGDFEVGPGPKYHVYLVPDAEVTPATKVPETRFVDLGRLRAFKGSQNYPVPAGVDPAAYGSVVIWCEYFGVLISPAKLNPI
jgi:hypothetical protein